MDPLLERYTKCEEAAASGQILQDLLEKARLTIESVVRRRLAFSSLAEGQDWEDVCGEVVLDLLRRLQALRDGENFAAIESFSGYVAAAADHACDEYLRRKYPQRRRLKNRLRYILSTEPRFAVWENAGHGHGHEWLCGLRMWQFRGQERVALSPEAPHGVAGSGQSRQSVVTTLASIFDFAQGPVLLDELVGMVARLWRISDRTEPIDPDMSGGSCIPNPESHLVQRRGLEELWKEICGLPVPQRAAVLLNLRSGEGESAVVFFPIMGIATIRQIAEILNIPAEEFANLWGQLPLDDQTIAGRLGITRQQVINLRKSARERLRRRVALSRTKAGSF